MHNPYLTHSFTSRITTYRARHHAGHELPLEREEDASGITIEMKAPGASTSMLLPNCRDLLLQRDRDRLASSASAKISATSMSFHTHRNWKMPSDAIAGPPSGMTTVVNSRSLARAVQPRRLQQFAGDLREEVPQQEDRERQTEADVEEDHTGDVAEDARSRRRASATGISATWTGTTSSADHDQEPPVAAGEVHPGEGVAGQRADDHDQHASPAR